MRGNIILSSIFVRFSICHWPRLLSLIVQTYISITAWGIIPPKYICVMDWKFIAQALSIIIVLGWRISARTPECILFTFWLMTLPLSQCYNWPFNVQRRVKYVRNFNILLYINLPKYALLSPYGHYHYSDNVWIPWTGDFELYGLNWCFIRHPICGWFSHLFILLSW